MRRLFAGVGGRSLLLNVLVILFASGAVIFTAVLGRSITDRRLATTSTNYEALRLTSALHNKTQLGRDWYKFQGKAMARPEEATGSAPALPASAVVTAYKELAEATDLARELHQLVGSETTLRILLETEDGQVSTMAYLQTWSASDGARLERNMGSMAAALESEEKAVTASTKFEQERLGSDVEVIWAAVIAAAALAPIATIGFTITVGRRQRRALAWALAEQARATEVSADVQRRNDQFAALYNVVTEVNDAMNLRHVINTTLKQVARIVPSGAVGLRLLRDGQLVLAGDAGGSLAANPAAVDLGCGLNGRSAKHGRIIRLAEGAAEKSCDSEKIAGVQSCLVLPLVVGARVVGTLECWSPVAGRYTADDEHILEMIAPQIATAIVAAEAYEASDAKARTDGLTGLPNRGQMEHDIEERYRLPAPDAQYALAMIDVDHFKLFNDRFGHAAGDTALRAVAKALASAVRGDDRVYRYGGEEFLVVLAGVNGETGARLAERMREKVERLDLRGPGGQTLGGVTISAGVAAYPEAGMEFAGVLAQADQALYVAKDEGRNRVTLSGSPEGGRGLTRVA